MKTLGQWALDVFARTAPIVSALAPSGRRSPAKFRHACAPSSRVAACSTTARLRQVLEHPPCYDLVPAPLAADLGARRYRAIASACHRPQPPILGRAPHCAAHTARKLSLSLINQPALLFPLPLSSPLEPQHRELHSHSPLPL